MSERLTFAYLAYTNSPTFGVSMIGVYQSLKSAKKWMDLVNGEYVPCDKLGAGKRVLQKKADPSGQFWYVEKHVMRN